MASLRQIVVNRRDAEARKQAAVLQRAQELWLQTQYPALLARQCIGALRGLSSKARTGFGNEICKQLKARAFERQLFIKDLWIADNTLTLAWSMVQSFLGGPRRQVRCGLPFQEVIDTEAPQSILGRDPVDTLYRLFEACVPSARRVFKNASSPLRLLHINDYILEKAFVYGIVALSKWLGEDRFPQGVYGHWPPRFPNTPVSEGAPPVDLEALTSAPSHVLALPELLPHLRQGSPASSSGA